jgi:hypothetical protein
MSLSTPRTESGEETVRKPCDPPTTHRYVRVMVDGKPTDRIVCKKCGNEKAG